MCGRYTNITEANQTTEYYRAELGDGLPGVSWNVAPTDPIPVVIERPDRETGEVHRKLRPARWGLVPSWMNDWEKKKPTINARVETLAEKPMFRTALAKRRCVIPADGYYEWLPVEDGGRVRKQPYYIHGDGLLSFAGLYELKPDETKPADDPGRWLWSATIITTDATGQAGEIHDRTPLLLPRDRVDAWLDPALTDSGKAAAVLAGIEMALLEVREVAPLVNRVANNGPELIEPTIADRALQLVLA